MRTHLFVLFCSFVAVAGLAWPMQAQDSGTQLLGIVNSLKQQQTEIADNQAKLDQKVDEVAAKISEARLFMSRAGGKHKPLPIPKK